MNKCIFYNNNHKRNERGYIVERDYSFFKAIKCSNCKKPIFNNPAFSCHGKSNIIIGLGKAIDLGNVDYCEDCVNKFKDILKTLNK